MKMKNKLLHITFLIFTFNCVAQKDSIFVTYDTVFMDTTFLVIITNEFTHKDKSFLYTEYTIREKNKVSEFTKNMNENFDGLYIKYY